MRCDECRHWEALRDCLSYHDGVCSALPGEKVDFEISGDYYFESIETMADFFCGYFEAKEEGDE